jgi:hypothetical protein
MTPAKKHAAKSMAKTDGRVATIVKELLFKYEQRELF